MGNVNNRRFTGIYDGNTTTVQGRLNLHYKTHKQGRLKIDGLWGSDTQRVYDAYRREVLHLKGDDATGKAGAYSMGELLGDAYVVV